METRPLILSRESILALKSTIDEWQLLLGLTLSTAKIFKADSAYTVINSRKRYIFKDIRRPL